MSEVPTHRTFANDAKQRLDLLNKYCRTRASLRSLIIISSTSNSSSNGNHVRMSKRMRTSWQIRRTDEHDMSFSQNFFRINRFHPVMLHIWFDENDGRAAALFETVSVVWGHLIVNHQSHHFGRDFSNGAPLTCPVKIFFYSIHISISSVKR